MNWITDTIAIGDAEEAQDAALLRRESIHSILGLITLLKDTPPTSLGVKRIEVVPLRDGPGNDPQVFLRSVDTLAELVRDAPPVLVHCRGGRFRAVVVVAGYFMRSLGLDAATALARVAAKRETFVLPFMEGLLKHIN